MLVVCFALPLLAREPGTRAANFPDPFAPNVWFQRLPAPAPWTRPTALYIVWGMPQRVGAFALLLGACLCLVALELKVLRRKDNHQSRLAESLALALRTGVLDSEEPRQPGLPLWCLWADTDEESEQAAPEPERRLTRYHLLGYYDQASNLPDARVVSIRQFGADIGSRTPDDVELTRGIPREFLRMRPSSSERDSKPVPIGLLEPARGDNPGKSFHDVGMLAYQP